MEPQSTPQPKLTSKKSFWISLIIGLIVIISIIIALVIYDIEENARIDAEAITFSTNPTIAFGEPAQVSDFAHPSDGTILEDYTIDTEQLGSVKVTFNYTNIKNKHRTKSFTLNIIDNTAPKIYGGNFYTVYQGYQGDLTDLMLSGDDLDDSPLREITGDYNLNKPGTYSLEYVITDAYSNQAKQPFTLQVIEPPTTPADNEPYEMPKLPISKVIKDYKTSRTKIGIDVSQWQGEIDWPKVKAAGVEFAIIRIGYQKGYGASYVLDPYFHANIQGALKEKLPVGVYFYSYADSVTEATRQAEWVHDNLSDYNIELGVAFDWEDWGNFNDAHMSFYTINKVANTFLDTLADYGYKGLLYSSKNYLERIWQPGQYPVWLAQYYDHVTYDGDYRIWQMSSSGQVNGIYGDVDLDIMYLK